MGFDFTPRITTGSPERAGRRADRANDMWYSREMWEAQKAEMDEYSKAKADYDADMSEYSKHKKCLRRSGGRND
jgi:hypothetical protein